MKLFFRRFLLFTLLLWIFLGISPVLTIHFIPDTPQLSASPSAAPTPTASVHTADTGSFRILDESDGTILTVDEEDFLPCALLCEMSPDAPEEALKAQAVAIHTACSRMHLQNAGEDADFSCNTETHMVYAPPEAFASQYSEDWEETFTRVKSLCADITGLCLYYEDELITAPYFAVSAGCTQPYEDVWGGEPLPYLQAVACPSDLLYEYCRAETRFTPEEIQAAFPAISFSAAPESWFSALQLNSAGYVKSISLCGNILSGTQVRTALSLRSAAFTATFDGEDFVFTTLGIGHGVGMSQTGAVYMAENGAGYAEILSYFYPGTTLK